ncbi:hypothetical protein CFL01nite_00320 [Corynebacterium flavescens]|uniref:Uncharacterized protein n=1 Tax=Corynebacterium flavescens TaxID=28028 RepID=A0AB73B4F8_CORFL|nr:hypothetical protein [Corynebacterium flavescens]KAA8722858.1 hypothetical protein F4V60_05400 [Corynebacterium flavescens]GEB96537.1 hypothetical protein CFL01nite_00320 [Corynebacterium flavescens]
MTASPAKQPDDSTGQAHYLAPQWTPAVDPDEFAKALVLIAETIHQTKGQKSKTKGQARHTKSKKGDSS